MIGGFSCQCDGGWKKRGGRGGGGGWRGCLFRPFFPSPSPLLMAGMEKEEKSRIRYTVFERERKSRKGEKRESQQRQERSNRLQNMQILFSSSSPSTRGKAKRVDFFSGIDFDSSAVAPAAPKHELHEVGLTDTLELLRIPCSILTPFSMTAKKEEEERRRLAGGNTAVAQNSAICLKKLQRHSSTFHFLRGPSFFEYFGLL